MNIEDIQDTVRLGTEISVILRSGHQFTGILSEMRETSIILRLANGNKVPLTADAIDCIFPDSGTVLKEIKEINITPTNSQNKPESVEFYASNIVSENKQSKTVEISEAYSIEIITRVAAIEAHFKTAIEQSKSDILPPDFTTPTEISSLCYSPEKRELLDLWSKLKSRYDNAIKNNDRQRLKQLTESLENIIISNSQILSIIQFNLGCINFQMGQSKKAIELFEQACIRSEDPRFHHNLAITVLELDEPKACYSFAEYFKRVSPSENTLSWYKFTDLTLKLNTISIFYELFEKAIKNNNQNDINFIVESIVFILKANNQEKIAYELIKQAEDSTDSSKLLICLRALISNLKLEIDESYIQQEKKVAILREELKKNETQAKTNKEVKNSITYAQTLAKRKQFNQAISELKKVLSNDPHNILAQELIEQYREADKKQTLPTGSGSYAQAKRAHIIEQDLVKAEKLYRDAIRQDEKAENAVKDLASLLASQNRNEEAIKMLKNYRLKSLNQRSIDNQLCTIYQSAKMYPDAIKLLNDILKATPKYDFKKQANILTQISFCEVKAGMFDEAEKTLLHLLKITPDNITAQKWFQALKQAKINNFYAPLEQIFIIQDVLNDSSSNIGKFLGFYLDRCEYKGLDEAKIANRNFSEEDFKKLRGLIEGAGRKRPGVRAQYHLSAAKLLLDFESESEQGKIRIYLEDYAGDMGDSCLLEQKSPDVILSYYYEAFAITPKWNRRLSDRLSRSLLLLLNKSSEKVISDNIPKPEQCLLEVIEAGRGRIALEYLLSISLNNPVAEFLLTLINQDKILKGKIQDLCYEILGEASELNLDFKEFTKLWQKARDVITKDNDEIIKNLGSLEFVAKDLGLLKEQITLIQSLIARVRGSLDKRRLKEIDKILSSLFDYSQQKAYTERERLVTIVKRQISQILEEIEKEPTKYSLELFFPYLVALERTLETHFQDFQLVTEPNELEINLSIDSYTPDDSSTIRCQITITNENGKSPVNSLKIHVKSSPNNEYIVQDKNIDVSEALPGGQSVTGLIPVTVTDIAKESQVFTLYYTLSFITRRENKKTSDYASSIKLYSNSDFQDIENPYATYAQGSTVEDKNMFYGRDQLINILLSSIRNASSAKSLVIYGQKRAGKSSVLYHLKKQLTLPIIPISFSIGDIIIDFSVGTFLYRIIQGIEDTFEDLSDEGYPSIDIQRPTLGELQQNPQLQFQDYMSNLRKSLKKVEVYKNAKIMLLIDEFSYIYGEIIRGRVQDTFMKSWKALLEKRHFGAVLVGQDTMPQFIDKFPNEFQVAEKQRISYLADDDARCLIIDPIRIFDTHESRYKGDAVNLLLRLTAGSPYYIQIFCNRLVEYMNKKKAIYVTDADIEEVKLDLISGHNSLDDSIFDNLISAGDSSVDEITKDDTLAVLRDIANGSRIQAYCDRSAINSLASDIQSTDKILENLIQREVIEKQGSSLYRIKVGLFKEWLLIHQ